VKRSFKFWGSDHFKSWSGAVFKILKRSGICQKLKWSSFLNS